MVLDRELPPRVLLRFLVDHLEERCPECGEAMALLKDPDGEAATPSPGPGVGAPSPGEPARRDLRELLRLPPGARPARVLNARTRFRSHELAEALFAEARRRGPDAPTEAAGLLALVPLVLRRQPAGAREDRRAALAHRAAAWRADALRRAGRAGEAAQAFRDLRHALAHGGVEDAALEAEIAGLEASLHADEGRRGEARRLLDRTARLLRRQGDGEGLARALERRGLLERLGGEPAAAEASHREALAAARRAGRDELAAAAAASLVAALCDLGRFPAAERVLEDHRDLLRRPADELLTRPLLDTLRGRVAGGLGRRDEAERLLRAAHRTLAAERRPLPAAVAALDLAILYLTSGRGAEVPGVARRLGEIFAAEDLDPGVSASLLLFQRAATAGKVTVVGLRQLQRQLEAATGRPRQALPS
jgi:tetratricopeptide (TPR) repeat protein